MIVYKKGRCGVMEEKKFDKNAYDQTYHRETTYYRKASFNRRNAEDEELVLWIDSQPESVSSYLKRLVAEDMAKNKK